MEKQAGGQQQNQQQRPTARPMERQPTPPHDSIAQPAGTFKDPPHDLETQATPSPTSAESSLDFNGRVGKTLFAFFRILFVGCRHDHQRRQRLRPPRPPLVARLPGLQDRRGVQAGAGQARHGAGAGAGDDSSGILVARWV